MRRCLLFCFVFGVLLVGFVLPVEGEAFTAVTKIKADSNNKNLYEFSDSEDEFKIKDSEGRVTTDLNDLESGSNVKLDEDGNVLEFHGTVNDEEDGATLRINGDQFSLTAGTQIDYVDGMATITPKNKGDEITYVRENGDDPISSDIKLGDGKLVIKKSDDVTTFSSESSFKISDANNDGVTNKMVTVEGLGEGEDAEIGINKETQIASFKNAKIDFANQGFTASSSSDTNVYYKGYSGDVEGDCVEKGGFLCIDMSEEGKEKLIFGSGSGVGAAGRQPSPVVEIKGQNVFFESDSDKDYFKVAAGPSSRIIIDKDRITTTSEHRVEMINGGDQFIITPEGDIAPSNIKGSTNDWLPMNMYTEDSEGKLNKYAVEVGKDGILRSADNEAMSKVTWLERKRYSAGRGDLYAMNEAKVSNVVAEVPDKIMEFPGFFKAEEKVIGYTLYTKGPKGKIQIGLSGEEHREIGGGTMGTSLTHEMCSWIDVPCGGGNNRNLDIIQLNKAMGTAQPFYVSVRTDNGSSYYFGNKSLDLGK